MEVVDSMSEYTKINEEWVRACMEEQKTSCDYCRATDRECLKNLMELLD